MLHLPLLALALFAAPRARGPDSDEGVRPLWITGARVLEEDASGWREGLEVLVRDGRIATIESELDPADTADAQSLDLSGCYLLPGLIDLHTHLLLHPYDEASWDDQVLRESLGLRTARAVASAAATLRAGFTTIRDLGTEVIGVSSDSVESHRGFTAARDIPFKLLSDANGEVRQRYGIKPTLGLIPGRATYVIDRQGIVRCVISSQMRPRLHVERALQVINTLIQLPPEG